MFTIRKVYLQFLSTPNFIHQHYKAIFKQDDHFQTHSKWYRATSTCTRGMRKYAKQRKIFMKKKCKKKKIKSYHSFPTILNYAMFINIYGSWQCLQIKTFYEWFQLCLYTVCIVQFFPKWVVHFWMPFCKNSIRISCRIYFIIKHGHRS